MLTILAVSLLAVAGCTNAVSYLGACDSAATCSDANTYCHKYSTCTKGRCICNSGYAHRAGSGCVQEVLLGASCSTYCTAGTCTSGTCQCQSGQTPSGDKRRCLGQNLGGSCTTVADCEGAYSGNVLSGSVTCTSGKCSCISGFQPLDNEVCIWEDDGSSCTTSSECYKGFALTQSATCTSGKCTCPTVSGTKYVWKQAYAGKGRTVGRTVGACLHPSSQEVGYGQTCTIGINDATTRICSAGHYCGLCPENDGTDKTVCLTDVAGHVRASLLVLLALLGVSAALLN